MKPNLFMPSDDPIWKTGCKKIAYHSRKLAMTQLRRWKQRKHQASHIVKNTLQVYRCQFCESWHVGNASDGKVKDNRRKRRRTIKDMR